VSYAYLACLILAVVVGFVAGFALLKRSHRWCPGCGAALRCLECTGQPTAHHVKQARGEGHGDDVPQCSGTVG